MSLVTRVSVAFLVALRRRLAGSPRACIISPGSVCGSRSTRSWRRRSIASRERAEVVTAA